MRSAFYCLFPLFPERFSKNSVYGRITLMTVDINATTQSKATDTPAVPTKKRVFSGIQPTGNLHLGNYLGALRNWVETQADYDNIFCIVDLHAITLPITRKELHESIRRLAALYIACGLNPDVSKI